METLQDTFGDLASFSLANEFINNTTNDVQPLSLLNYEYITFIYIGIAILVIIVGLLIYKFNFVKRAPPQDSNVENNSQRFDGYCPI
jgi:hypothetical protein